MPYRLVQVSGQPEQVLARGTLINITGLEPARCGHAPSAALSLAGNRSPSWEAGLSIGATLAAARRHAGLTVAEVSQRTRVRENIIRGIEQDDYAACGGDFYARGHIRAIAEAVGTDPAPLIEEFDERWRSSPELTAAEVFQPSIPLRKRERRRVRWTGILAVLVLAVLGFAVYKFVAGAGRPLPRLRPPASTRPTAVSPARPRRSRPASRPARRRPARPPPPRSALAAQALTPAAWRPSARRRRDPQQAALAISGNPATPGAPTGTPRPSSGRCTPERACCSTWAAR